MLLTLEQQKIFDDNSIPKFLTVNFYADTLCFLYPSEDLFPSDGIYPGQQADSTLVDSLDGSRIVASSLIITESISSNQNLTFGTVTANKLSIKVETDIDTVGLFVEVKIKADTTELPLFYGVVDNATRSTTTNRVLKTITAYDILYYYLDLDCTDWYNSLEFPMTILEFRTYLASSFGLNYEEIDLVNDSIEIDKYVSANTELSITARNLLKYVCEINGVFASVNRYNKIVFLSLVPYSLLYPSDDLLPSDDLFAGIQSETQNVHSISSYIPSDYGDYRTQEITRVEVYDSQNNLLYAYGDGDNTYTITDNYMTSAMSSDDLESAIQNFYYLVNYISYIPISLSCQSKPYLEVGDVVGFPVGTNQITSFILQRTLTFTRDKLEASGEEYHNKKYLVIESEET